MKNVKDTTDKFLFRGNPFCERNILVLHTNDFIPEKVGNAILKAEEKGKSQYKEFVTKRLEEWTVAIGAPIPANNLYRPGNLPTDKQSLKKHTVKDDLNFIGRLYLTLESREGEVDKLFRHENEDEPTSLSKDGKLRTGTKSNWLNV